MNKREQLIQRIAVNKRDTGLTIEDLREVYDKAIDRAIEALPDVIGDAKDKRINDIVYSYREQAIKALKNLKHRKEK